jgi:hypothetical protein
MNAQKLAYDVACMDLTYATISSRPVRLRLSTSHLPQPWRFQMLMMMKKVLWDHSWISDQMLSWKGRGADD